MIDRKGDNRMMQPIGIATNDRIRFETIIDEMADTFTQKNAMYGNSFEDLLNKLGPISGVAQIVHKTNRLVSLANGTKNDAESMRDTLLDLANYCVMQAMWMDKESGEI